MKESRYVSIVPCFIIFFFVNNLLIFMKRTIQNDQNLTTYWKINVQHWVKQSTFQSRIFFVLNACESIRRDIKEVMDVKGVHDLRKY